MAEKNKRNELPLSKKIELLKFLEAGNSERKATEKFKVCRSSDNRIKHKKDDLHQQFEIECYPSDCYRKHRKTEYEKFNDLVWKMD